MSGGKENCVSFPFPLVQIHFLVWYLHIILRFLPVGLVFFLTLRQFICPKEVPKDNEEAHNLVILTIFYLED